MSSSVATGSTPKGAAGEDVVDGIVLVLVLVVQIVAIVLIFFGEDNARLVVAVVEI